MAKLLIIADLEGKGHATPRGLELAHKLGVGAEVVAFAYASLDRLGIGKTEQAGVRTRLLDERRRVVQARIDKHRESGQKVGLTVAWEKDIHKWINKACAGDTYLAVIKTGHRSDSLVHTSTDWQLLRECPAPVLIVAAKKWHRTRPVLVTLDLGTTVAVKRKLNHRVLQSAQQLANALGVDLDKRGPVEKVITSRAAKVRAQIVVMGTVGRKGVRAHLLGNTAEKVLRHLKTDVLAIKP
jgi:universal stress protein E